LKPKSKIFSLILLQVTIIIASFFVLILLEQERSTSGESINLAGKNRYFSATLMHELMEYHLTSDPSMLIFNLNEFTNNLEELELILQNDSFLFPISNEIKTEFSKILNDHHKIKSEILLEIESGSISESQEKSFDVQLTNLISNSDELTFHLSDHAEDLSFKIIIFELFLAILNIFAHIVLIVVIIRVQKTESKKTAIANKQLDNYKTALDKSAIVAITNLQGDITYVNDKFCEISKYSEKELLGKNHRILKSGYHSPEFYLDLWSTISKGNVWYGLVKNKAKDGTFYWVATSIVPLTDETGKTTQYISIRQDMTKQKEFEEKFAEKEKLSVIGQLTARLTHDLRNPLSIIQLSLENLKMLSKPNESQQKIYEKIERSIDRITHQVDDVLGYVRKNPLNTNKTKFSEILAESVDAIKIPNDVRLVFPKNDGEIDCDKRQLVTVMNNLFLNAIQAMNEKGLIAISLDEKDDEIIIQIEDSGKGIPKNDIPKLFEPMYTTKQSGTGLGLISVKSIIEAHGGIISVASPPTIFTITLPKESET